MNDKRAKLQHDLRERALMRVRGRAAVAQRPATLQQVTHELLVHQAELELQNEELRRAEAELEASRSEYARLYDQAPVAYFSFDRQGEIQRANLTAAALLGVERSRLIGVPFARFLDAESADTFYVHRRAAQTTREQETCEVRVHGATGQPHICRLDSLCIEEGERLIYQSTLIDRTTQKRAELALRESEARLREITEHVEDAFWVVERDGHMSYQSPGFARVWGRATQPSEPGPLGWTGWIHTLDQARARSEAAKLRDGTPLDAEYRIADAGSLTRFVHVRAFPVLSEHAEVQRYIFVARDVTAERALEQELQQVQKMEAIGALASGMAHDSRNVLQALIGCMRIALDDPGISTRTRGHLERGLDAAKSGARLTDQLMVFARKELAHSRPLRIDELLQRTAPLLQRLLGDAIVVSLHLNCRDGVIRADPVQLEQILLNLASNARDAMPQGGTLTVTSEPLDFDALHAQRSGLPGHGPHVRLRIADTGSGMDEETKRRIFEPFFTTKGQGRGTGLGLSTVFAIAEKLSGHVSVESELGKGTVFTLLLPLVDDIPSSLAAPAADDIQLTGSVLLVEDNDAVRAVLSEQLQRLGLAVTEAQSGPHALALCAALETLPDVLVSDAMMPGMTGFELAARLRQRAPELPVLYLSAYAPEDLLCAGAHVPSAALLRKPVDQDELQQELRTLLARARSAQPVGVAPPKRCVPVVEDAEASRLALCDILEGDGFSVLPAASAAAARRAVEEHTGPVHVLLTDLNLPDMRGQQLASLLRQRLPELKIVYMSGESDPDVGNELLFQKPLDLDALSAALK